MTTLLMLALIAMAIAAIYDIVSMRRNRRRMNRLMMLRRHVPGFDVPAKNDGGDNHL